MPREVRYDRGPQFAQDFDNCLADIKVEPIPSSEGTSSSNGLAKYLVKSTKLPSENVLRRKQATQRDSATSTKRGWIKSQGAIPWEKSKVLPSYPE